MLGLSAEGPGGGSMGWGGLGGMPYGYISILDIGYWIFIYTDIHAFSRKRQKVKKSDEVAKDVMSFESHRRSQSNPNKQIG